MSDPLTIRTTWMRHSGGTKYYQIFEFKPKSGVPITLVHYGPVTPRVTRFHRPVNGGQVDIHRGALGLAKQRAKEGRGYSEDDSQTSFVNRGHGNLREIFGAQLAHELDVAMYGHLAAADTAPSDDPDNEFVPADEAPEERPAAWGSW